MRDAPRMRCMHPSAHVRPPRHVARQAVALAISFAVVGIAAWVGSAATATSVGSWYVTLEKPTWTPPGAVIGAVWTVLYVAMAIAAWLVWRRAGFDEARAALALFAAQLVLNASWSAIFFGLRAPGAALAEIVVLWVAVLATTLAFWRHSRVAGALMLPYLAWVAFAAFLNAAIWLMN